MNAFPDEVQPQSEMSDELVSHVRYPEDLFKVQREILTRYHVDDPVDFYNANDRWQIPEDPTQQSADDQPPYYILAQRPTDDSATFQLTSALNAFERDNLSAFISASSDPETYGEIKVLRLPGNTPFRGPQQVQNAFLSNNQVRPDLTLFDSENSDAVFGNLLTLPIGDAGLLYVEPLYVRGAGESGFPLLQRVLVNFGDRIGYADTLADALNQVFGAGAGEVANDSGEDPTPDEPDGTPTSPTTTPSAPTTTPPPDGGGTTVDPDLADEVAAINDALAALEDAQQSGDFAAQGQALEELQAAVEAYQAAQEAAGDGGG
jgi:uncharacterized membrane protein (UPF0182 family)